MLISTWNFNGSGSYDNPPLDDTYPFVNFPTGGQFFGESQYTFALNEGADLTDAEGLGAQNNANPKAHFLNHKVVLIGSEYYDPSYGTTHASRAMFGDQIIDGFVLPMDPAGLSEATYDIDFNGDGDKVDSVEIAHWIFRDDSDDTLDEGSFSY